MQTHTGSRQRWLVLPLVVLALTACATNVTQGPSDAPIAISGGWNDATARATAEAMVKEVLKQPWQGRFAKFVGRAPVVSVGPVVNRTAEPLNTETFARDLERALANSGQVQFVANTGPRQENNPRANTAKPAGQEGGADFMLQGAVSALVDERDSTKSGVYQVDLELVDLASNVQVWQGQRRIKKL